MEDFALNLWKSRSLVSLLNCNIYCEFIHQKFEEEVSQLGVSGGAGKVWAPLIKHHPLPEKCHVFWVHRFTHRPSSWLQLLWVSSADSGSSEWGRLMAASEASPWPCVLGPRRKQNSWISTSKGSSEASYFHKILWKPRPPRVLNCSDCPSPAYCLLNS